MALTVGLVITGLGVHFAVAGLDDADKLASVVGGVAGIIGVGLSVYGLALARRVPGTSPESAGPASAPGGDTVTNTIGGTVHGPVLQGHDFTGPITLGSSSADPAERTPRQSGEGPRNP
ncbi:hypothetical protein ACLQ2R_08215 [Streptosporangium sp. DT93]|uniref:hypothetical protein n=1 Tax=Streptosporangium sp. DT93 TaxID=3393428 RepID=UPI003CF938CD